MRCLLFALFVFIIASCSYHPKEKRLSKFGDNKSKILKSFYEIDKDTIRFIRLINGDNEITCQSGEIFLGKYAMNYQRIKVISKVKQRTNTIDSLQSLFLGQGFKPEGREKEEMFVQIVPDSSMTNIDVLRFLNLRQDVEDKLDKELKSQNLGEWFAGDMGAGANMLFSVYNWNEAVEVTTRLLEEEKLLDHVIIARRIMISEEDWSYEIVYPLAFNGAFNTM